MGGPALIRLSKSDLFEILETRDLFRIRWIHNLTLLQDEESLLVVLNGVVLQVEDHQVLWHISLMQDLDLITR